MISDTTGNVSLLISHPAAAHEAIWPIELAQNPASDNVFMFLISREWGYSYPTYSGNHARSNSSFRVLTA
jgi:hypothetical protein